jgi:hypothetical protein
MHKKTLLDPMKLKHDFESVKTLEEEIQQLDEQIKTENRRAYIREQIDDVMRQFGYNTAESIVLRGATKGHSYLFESDSKAVHLFISDTNRIMLEPVGLDGLEGSEHAGYDGMIAENISETDRAFIFEDQKEFCETHPKMVEELRKRGVLLNNTQIKEANAQYAKQLRIKGKQRKRKQGENQEHRRFTEQKQREIKIN